MACARVSWRRRFASSPLTAAAAGAIERDGELIQVARVVVVDRAPEEITQIAERAVAGIRLTAQRLGLPARGGREVRLETALEHRTAGDVTEALAGGRAQVHEDRFMIAWRAMTSRTTEVVVCGAGIAGIATA